MRRRTIILIAVLITVVVAGMGGARWLIAALGPASIEAVVHAMGFRPQRPPNTLYGPGGLYQVNTFGQVTPICDADSSKVVLSEGRTEARIIRAFSIVENKSRVWGKMNTAEATSKGASTASVLLVLQNPIIRGGDLATLSKINEELQRHPHCRRELDRALRAGRCVAQSRSVLIATLDFELHESGAVEIGGDGNLTPQVLELAVNAGFARSDLRFGEKLYYGLQLTDRCMARPDDSYGRYVPDETWWFLKTTVNTFHTFLEMVGI